MVDLTVFRTGFLPACEFARRAFTQLDSLHDEAASHERRGAIKKLVEEVIPLGIVAKHLDGPERAVVCRYLGSSNEPADGELRLSGKSVDLGFYPSEIFVEVTTAEHPWAYLQREALGRHGHVFGGSDIKRSTSRHKPDSEIVSRASVQDPDRVREEAAACVRKAIERKAAREYAVKPLLAVRIEADSIFGFSDYRYISAAAAAREQQSKFIATYLVDNSSGWVLEIS